MCAARALEPDGPAALADFKLTPDTIDRLRIYEARLRKWQPMLNLVAPSTLGSLWTRHFADSLQVSDIAPEAKQWVDMGSGGGFPGLVTAIRLGHVRGARVHLIESDQRKCAFLRDVSRETGAPVIIHPRRIDVVMAEIEEPIDAISARALAPLSQLVAHAKKFLEKGAIGVFPKGQSAARELTEARLDGRFSIELIESRIEPPGSAKGHIIVVRGI